MSNFKYQSQIDESCAECSCPEEDFCTFEDKECYRFIFNDMSHPHNFLPVAFITPSRVLTDDCHYKCALYGLSLYAKKEGAIQKYKELTKMSSKKFKEKIGTHIAKGIISPDLGQITKEGYLTHFELYEFENVDISRNFSMIEPL